MGKAAGFGMSAAWDEGYEARLEGLDDSANPYREGTVLHAHWQQGYVAAEEEFGDAA